MIFNSLFFGKETASQAKGAPGSGLRRRRRRGRIHRRLAAEVVRPARLIERLSGWLKLICRGFDGMQRIGADLRDK